MHNICETIFYMNTNVLQDFHICMSVPLSISQCQAVIKLIEKKIQTKGTLKIGYTKLANYLTLIQKLYQKLSPQS